MRKNASRMEHRMKYVKKTLLAKEDKTKKKNKTKTFLQMETYKKTIVHKLLSL
jgi:hypothetical protein